MTKRPIIRLKIDIRNVKRDWKPSYHIHITYVLERMSYSCNILNRISVQFNSPIRARGLSLFTKYKNKKKCNCGNWGYHVTKHNTTLMVMHHCLTLLVKATCLPAQLWSWMMHQINLNFCLTSLIALFHNYMNGI